MLILFRVMLTENLKINYFYASDSLMRSKVYHQKCKNYHQKVQIVFQLVAPHYDREQQDWNVKSYSNHHMKE